ncbi:MAG TPA: endolytic transglycosylase MltG [Steroidobacteraceae bacterium]|nr:endolytic transglycosylase MltG [Steroidobacteraceae bacterium]
MRRALLSVLTLLFVAAAAAAIYWQHTNQVMQAAGPNREPVALEVKPGASVRAVLAELDEKGALAERRAVELQLRVRGAPAIKTGRYSIPAGASPAEILRQLEEGRVVLETLTVVEGWTFADMRRVIEAHPQLRITLRDRDAAGIMEAIGHRGEHPEGRFFPDTYRFAAGTTDRDLYALAYRKMAEALDSAWSSRAANLPLKDPYEALILASIVEKETGLASERPRIAGVFVTRLRRNMRLQTDPTVIYGIGASYDGNIRERDLRTDTPYNTYTRGGLPPTPIALPSREAIEAVTHPMETGDIFFVATGAGDGSHVFSATLEAHNAAVARYLARLRGQRLKGNGSR